MSEPYRISGTQDESRLADVVFVHGLGGDAFETWRYGADQTTSWPHWLGEEFPQVGVWSVGYAASPSRWLGWLPWLGREAGQGMSLPTRAKQLLDQMTMVGLGERPIFFIGHSLGGLVIKQMLRVSSDASEERLKQVFTKTRAVMFLATPHGGAGLASLARGLRTIFGATVTIQELKAHDPNLLDLHDWYRNHADTSRIRTRTYYEQMDVHGVTIVNSTSAHPGVGADPVGLDEDHLSISKPRLRTQQVCDAARDVLRNWVLKTVRPPRITFEDNVTEPASVEGSRIPFQLPPIAEEFVGRQHELGLLTDRLRAGKNTAVVGPAGMGKTAMAAKGLREVFGEHGEGLAESHFPDGVVYLDLYALQGRREAAWEALATAVRGGDFMQSATARERVTAACEGRKLLLVIEGGEEADGLGGRLRISELWDVLGRKSGWLLLTRLKNQVQSIEMVEIRDFLQPEDAGRLFDIFTGGRVKSGVRERMLTLLAGHPLALTWAGNLLGRDEEDPDVLVRAWETGKLPRLNDPTRAEHTLEWLFERSVAGLTSESERALQAAGLLAHASFPAEAILTVLGDGQEGEDSGREALRLLVQRSLLRRGEGNCLQFTHVLGYRFARKERGVDGQVLSRLGAWLHQHLKERLWTQDQDAGSVAQALEHLDALLRADERRELWRPLAEDSLYDFRERLVDLGRLGQAKQLILIVTRWMEQLPVDERDKPIWQRERSSTGEFLGDVLMAQGDVPGALTSYRASLEIARRLAETDPSNAGWQRDVSVSHNKVGNVLMEQGDVPGALTSYRASLEIRRRLAEGDPSNAGWQRDVSVSHDKVGNVLMAQGDVPGALTSYRASLEIARRLAEADPSNAGWQRDLSVSHEKVGDVLMAQGDVPGALTSYRASLEIMRRLAEADPSNAGWQRDLSYSLTKMVQLAEDWGEPTEAFEFAEESLGIDERLATLDPTNATWRNDVLISRAMVERLRRGLKQADAVVVDEGFGVEGGEVF